MNDINPIILVPVIAGTAAIIPAIIARSTAIAVATRTGKKDSDKNAIEYLNRKIELLQQNKQLILEENRKPIGEISRSNMAQQDIDRTEDRFELAAKIFENISHYLKNSYCSTLRDRIDRINESIGFLMGLDRGIIKSSDDWTGDKSRLIERGNMIAEMKCFADAVYDTIEEELRESTKQVEQLAGLL